VIVLAIDPGNTHSAWVLYDADARALLSHGKHENAEVRALILSGEIPSTAHFAIEFPESFGAKVWNQVFLTALWAGRFIECWGGPHVLMSRVKVKTHVTGSAKSKDAQVRQCLLDRWGGENAKRKGGPLYGVTADRWAALAIAVAYADGAGFSVVHAQEAA
jgi:hypothetical protein